MAVTAADFKLRFPEFNDTPNARIELFLSDVVLIHMGEDELRWSGKYNIAQAYLAAHLLSAAMLTEGGDTTATEGSVIESEAGDVRVKTSAKDRKISHGDGFYMTTSYGQQFIVIRNICFNPILVANRL